MQHITKQLAILLAGIVFGASASAQDYPNKPVKIVVSYAAGAAPDLVARILGERLTQTLGQPFVVDNRPGAAGVVGGGLAARAAPDGYTLLIGDTSTLLLAPLVIKNLPYEPLKVFKPIAMTASLPYLLASSAKGSNIKSIQDLIREAKANPGKLNYGSPGFGSNHHIIMEAFAAEAGIQLTHIPYGPQLNPALIAGDIPIALTSLATLAGAASNGSVHLLGVTTPTRFAMIPNVPAINEVLKGFEFTSEQGVVAPAGVPNEIIDKLSSAIKAALEHPDVVARFKTLNITPTYLNAAGYAENLRVNSLRFGRAVKIAKVEPS